MIGPRAVVQALVALFEYGSHSTAVNSPGGMVVDLGLSARRPDEDLQREGMVLAFVAMGHVPVFSCVSPLVQKGKDLSLKKGGILHKMSKEKSGLLQGQFRGKFGELLQFVRIQHH
jgi:hypothetical protein